MHYVEALVLLIEVSEAVRLNCCPHCSGRLFFYKKLCLGLALGQVRSDLGCVEHCG